MFILGSWKIETQQSKLIYNCESGKAKQTFLIEKNVFQSEANMFLLVNFNIGSNRMKLILNRESREAKGT